jgi:hypothetical protein
VTVPANTRHSQPDAERSDLNVLGVVCSSPGSRRRGKLCFPSVKTTQRVAKDDSTGKLLTRVTGARTNWKCCCIMNACMN